MNWLIKKSQFHHLCIHFVNCPGTVSLSHYCLYTFNENFSPIRRVYYLVCVFIFCSRLVCRVKSLNLVEKEKKARAKKTFVLYFVWRTKTWWSHPLLPLSLGTGSAAVQTPSFLFHHVVAIYWKPLHSFVNQFITFIYNYHASLLWNKFRHVVSSVSSIRSGNK